jgi:hypothetical protein
MVEASLATMKTDAYHRRSETVRNQTFFWCSSDTAYPFKEAQRGSFPKGDQNPSLRYLLGVHSRDFLRKL